MYFWGKKQFESCLLVQYQLRISKFFLSKASICSTRQVTRYMDETEAFIVMM